MISNTKENKKIYPQGDERYYANETKTRCHKKRTFREKTEHENSP